jgi:hypothetical protein
MGGFKVCHMDSPFGMPAVDSDGARTESDDMGFSLLIDLPQTALLRLILACLRS